jgi:hypothetical protein
MDIGDANGNGHAIGGNEPELTPEEAINSEPALTGKIIP